MELVKDSHMNIRLASAIQLTSRYVNIGVQLLVSMVLARILTPEEYGTMAIVSVFLGFFSTLSSLGVGSAVIQYGELTLDDCSALLTFTGMLGVILSLAFCVLSIPVSMVYGDTALVPLMCASSVAILFNSLNMVPNGLLAREKRFLAIGVRLIVTSAVTGMVAILAALAGMKTYALVIYSVLQSLLNAVWNIAASGVDLRPRGFKRQLALIGRFSAYQSLAQLTQYIIRNLDNMLIGGVFGAAQLGLYNKAYNLAKYPANVIPGTLTPVLKSFFASKDGDLDALYKLYFRIQKAFSVIGWFGAAVCVSCSREIILLAYGDQWVGAIEPFRLLSASMAPQITNFTVFAVLEGARRTDYLLHHTIISSLVIVVLLMAGLHTKNLVITSALVSAGLILYTVPKLYYVVSRTFGRSISRYVVEFIPEIASAIVSCCATVCVGFALPDNLPLQFFVKGAVCVVAYLVLARMSGQTKYLLELVPASFRDKLSFLGGRQV